MQNPLKLLYPDQCVLCGMLVEAAPGLCPACWAETPFLDGLVCDACGEPLMGEAGEGRPLCDDCLTELPPWHRARAALAYDGAGRRLVLGLKHGDRLDLVAPAAGWMASRGRGLACPGAVLVPVPLHWTRLLRRRYNQAALLAREIGRLWGVGVLHDGLRRCRRTAPQERMSRAERMANQAGAFQVPSARGAAISGASVVILIDDVMTSGATARAATGALLAAGACEVRLLTLARVVSAW